MSVDAIQLCYIMCYCRCVTDCHVFQMCYSCVFVSVVARVLQSCIDIAGVLELYAFADVL